MRLTVANRYNRPLRLVQSDGSLVELPPGAVQVVDLDDQGVSRVYNWWRSRVFLHVHLPDGTPIDTYPKLLGLLGPVAPSTPATEGTPDSGGTPPPPTPPPESVVPALVTDSDVEDFARSHTAAGLRTLLRAAGLDTSFSAKAEGARRLLEHEASL